MLEVKGKNPFKTEYIPKHYILEESNFNFIYVRLSVLNIPMKNG